MTSRTATVAEVRKHYKDQGHTVRIDRKGHVEFQRGGDGPWLEGRWVEEYRTQDAYAESGTTVSAQTYLR